MTYDEIIQNNAKLISVKWWSYHAYHYTDIENVIPILTEECLYSRYDAQRLNLMKNDNASRQVINMTKMDVVDSVRFYFRPKTPTQYHNEGYKHPSLRYDGDLHANVPVPVFLVFDLSKVLKQDEVYFSETSQAGGGSRLCNTPEEFAELDFQRIYANGSMENPAEDKRYRHAEILAKSPFYIDSCLEAIVCRNACEKITLLNLLREKSIKAYVKYQDKIKVCGRDLFECNGLYVTDCRYCDGISSISFSDTGAKRRYTERYKKRELEKLRATIDFVWASSQKVLERQSASFWIDYENMQGIQFKGLHEPSGARILYTIIKIEDKLMCYMGQHLSEAAML